MIDRGPDFKYNNPANALKAQATANGTSYLDELGVKDVRLPKMRKQMKKDKEYQEKCEARRGARLNARRFANV